MSNERPTDTETNNQSVEIASISKMIRRNAWTSLGKIGIILNLIDIVKPHITRRKLSALCDIYNLGNGVGFHERTKELGLLRPLSRKLFPGQYTYLDTKFTQGLTGYYLVKFPQGGYGLFGFAVSDPNQGPTSHLYTFKRDREAASRLVMEIPRIMGANRVTLCQVDPKVPNRAWAVTRLGRLSTLDDIPLHSTVRAALDEHLAWCTEHWSSMDNATYEATRNLLFWGVPGTCKTTVVYLLAKQFTGRVYEFPDGLSRDSFWKKVRNMNCGSLVVADEADSISMFKKPEKHTISLSPSEDLGEKANIKDALAYMTGPQAPISTSTIIISNTPEEIDQRLLRKGRIYKKIEFLPVDDPGLRVWLKHRHNFEVSDRVTLRSDLVAADIFAKEEELDDVESLVHYLTVRDGDQPK